MQRHAAQLVQADTINTTAKVLDDWLSDGAADTGLVIDGFEAAETGEEVVFHVINHARANHRRALCCAEAPVLPVRLPICARVLPLLRCLRPAR